MWPFKSIIEYKAVSIDEEKCEANPADVIAASRSPPRDERKPSYLVLIGTIITLALLTIGVCLVSPPDAPYYNGFIPGTEELNPISIAQPSTAQPSTAQPSTAQPSTAQPSTAAANTTSRCSKRQEWRTLSQTQQQAYISAVLCLREQPSVLAPTSNRTSYDDFPWIHSHVGYFTHNAAPFLPWHRYFLHIYETTLRDACGYTGGLVYWDWTQDSAALEKSPVFDAETGFGGDGQVGGEITAGKSGRCVVDGPFANVTADYYDVEFQPHCLSRGFRDENGQLGHIDGHEIRPESIEEVLQESKYEDFVKLMESRVHDAIPFGIAGDFETFTAPYDPLFFLHHTQLDRLWWLWQQRQPDDGLVAYSGRKQRHSMEMASLDDTIHMKGLATDVAVADVMNVEGELLCYTY